MKAGTNTVKTRKHSPTKAATVRRSVTISLPGTLKDRICRTAKKRSLYPWQVVLEAMDKAEG